MSNEIQKTNKREINKNNFPELFRYMENKHETLKNNYRTPDGQYIEHSTLIACDIADILLKEGKKPYIMSVGQQIKEGSFITNKKLIPKAFGSEVIFFAYHVCCCDEMAFDPILEKPVEIDKYSETVFGEEIHMEVLIPQAKIKEFVSRGNNKAKTIDTRQVIIPRKAFNGAEIIQPEIQVVEPGRKYKYPSQQTEKFLNRRQIYENSNEFSQLLSSSNPFLRLLTIGRFQSLEFELEKNDPTGILEVNIDGYIPVEVPAVFVLSKPEIPNSTFTARYIMFRKEGVLPIKYLSAMDGNCLMVLKTAYDTRFPSVKKDERFDISTIPVTNAKGFDRFLRLYQSKKK